MLNKWSYLQSSSADIPDKIHSDWKLRNIYVTLLLFKFCDSYPFPNSIFNVRENLCQYRSCWYVDAITSNSSVLICHYIISQYLTALIVTMQHMVLDLAIHLQQWFHDMCLPNPKVIKKLNADFALSMAAKFQSDSETLNSKFCIFNMLWYLIIGRLML